MSRRSGIDVVFVAGPPGAGKTTVTEGYQVSHPNVDRFGTGELVWGIRDGSISSEYAAILQDAARNGLFLPDSVHSLVVQERIKRVADATDTVMVTGFPHDYGDWEMFTQVIAREDINLLGSIALDVGLETSIARMQQRDVLSGLDSAAVVSPEAYAAYEKRYFGLMGRHAVRLNCYRNSGLEVISLSAERPPDEVLADFSQTMDVLKERKKEHVSTN